MLKKSWNTWFKVCALFAALFIGAATLPAAVAEAACGGVKQDDEAACGAAANDDEAAVRRIFVDSMTKGIIKGLELTGKQVSPEQRTKIRAIADVSFPKIYARIQAGGLCEEYKKQMFDKDIRNLDKKVLAAKTLQEVAPVAQQQMKIIRERYPKLYQFMNTDKEMQAVTMEMMRNIAEAIK